MESKINLNRCSLVVRLISVLGAKISKASLLIWPNDDGLLDTDTKLNLELELVTGVNSFITFGTEPDGQTPLIENELIDNPMPYSLLNKRVIEWQRSIFSDDGSCHVESFEINSSVEYQGIKNSIIEDIELICYADTLAPAGLKLTFSTGAIIWSVSAGDGNRIFTVIPEPWFNEQMVLVSVKNCLEISQSN